MDNWICSECSMQPAGCAPTCSIHRLIWISNREDSGPGFWFIFFLQMVHSFNTPANIRLLEMNGIFSGVWIWRLFPFYPQNNEVQGWESKMAGRIKGCGARSAERRRQDRWEWARRGMSIKRWKSHAELAENLGVYFFFTWPPFSAANWVRRAARAARVTLVKSGSFTSAHLCLRLGCQVTPHILHTEAEEHTFDLDH